MWEIEEATIVELITHKEFYDKGRWPT